MRTDMATVLAFGLVCGANAAAPTYSCFDPPDEGQTNPLGEGLEDVVEAECCEALIDESDIIAERKVIWDPINCNHGPGETAITEAFLCRAHDTDGCRFCRDSCDGFEGLCVTCNSAFEGFSDSPTPSPDFSFEFTDPATPAPTATGGGDGSPTEAPFGIFPATPAPTTTAAAPSDTPAPTIDPNNTGDVGGAGGDLVDTECQCVENLTEVEAEVLQTRGKTLVCDPTCSDGSDLTWGVLNCNYFALGQNCRTCADTCEESADGTWVDTYGALCKPCSAVVV